MKKFFVALAVVLGVGGVGIYTFREPLAQAAMNAVTSDMFVARDTDGFDPGVAVGKTLPAMLVRFEGRELTGVAQFMGERGMVLFVNRSVDW